MASRTARNMPPADRPDLAGTSADETRERIQWFYGKKNLDALRDEAVTLANRVELTQHQIQKLGVLQEALRAKLEAVTAHEHYSVVITGIERNGRLVAEVAGLGQGRVQVAVHPEIDPEKLIVGATGLVTSSRNCLLKLTAAPGRWKDVATFEKYLDSPHRALVRDRETQIAVDLAHGLRDKTLTKGDLIGFDREVGLAYERLEAPRADHLFDEQVTDDFSQLGGLDCEIARIKQHIDFRFRFPKIAARYALKSKCGILLKGVPGNGKTRIARCCAGYVRQIFPDRPCRFMHVAGSSDYSMWFGDSEQKIIARFKAASEASRDGLVVMFWDEADAIAKRRGTDYGSGAPDRVLNTLLSQIDGIVSLNNVILIFATNRADMLDPGLLRPGRVDEKIEIPAPNRRAVQAILRCYLDRGLPLADSEANVDDLIAPLVSRLFAPNGEFAEVAQVNLNDGRRLRVAGRQLLSGALLENVVHVAAQAAAVREAETGDEGLTEEDLAVALENEMVSAVALLAPGNVKNYVKAIPQDAQPIAVNPLLTSTTSTYFRTR